MRFRNRDYSLGLGNTAVLGTIALFIAVVYGYVCNIIAIVQTMNDPLAGIFIARCVGIFFAPLGVILGYF